MTHNGKPIAGATVTFVPEKFLGENRMVATGKTDANGVATMSHGQFDVLGWKPAVVPGFYRVEIEKQGERIPSKYNTDTILGQKSRRTQRGFRATAMRRSSLIWTTDRRK